MTPARLLALVTRALGRPPQPHEVTTWREVLACPSWADCPPADCVHDTEADEALKAHQATSTYPAAPADVRRIAVGIANMRVDRELAEQRRREAEQGVPPTPEYLAAAAELRRKQAERARELEGDVDDDPHARREAIRRALDAEQQTTEEVTT